MGSVVSVLVIVVSIALVLIVLVQDSKGGGLASNFSSQNQIMGVRKTTDFLGKATWYLASFLLVLSLASVMVVHQTDGGGDSEFDQKINQMGPSQNEIPAFPSATGAEGQASEEATPEEGNQ